MTVLPHLKREAKFLAKRRSLLALFSVIFLLSGFAVWSGMSESLEQTATIERLLEKDQIDRESVLAHQPDYGSAAYYSYHLTYSKPSPLAFAAMGQRDITPWKHRIGMLALEGQIYETDADNPELSFLGRFDFAFFVSVLLPLFVILLIHDLRASEREAGRYDLLLTTVKHQNNLWLTRATILCSALAVAIILPFVIGAIVMQAPLFNVGLIILVTVAHVLFWALLTFWFISRKALAKQSSTHLASMLLSIWLVVTVMMPVSNDMIIDEMVESPNGGDILLLQRETVNDAWDLPFSATWDKFLATHPKWKEHTEMDALFEWKWYFAFQQVGDQTASDLSTSYREATLEKNRLAGLMALVSPPMLTQRLMSAIAETDTHATLRYEQQIRNYHKQLRHFYYPLLFNNVEYNQKSMAKMPQFSEQ